MGAQREFFGAGRFVCVFWSLVTGSKKRRARNDGGFGQQPLRRPLRVKAVAKFWGMIVGGLGGCG